MATHSSVLAWKIPWTKEPTGLQSMGWRNNQTQLSDWAYIHLLGFPSGPAGKESTCSGFDPWVGKLSWRREWLPTPVFWPGEFHGLYSPWDHKQSDTTEGLAQLNITELTYKVLASCLSWRMPPDCRLFTGSMSSSLSSYQASSCYSLPSLSKPAILLLCKENCSQEGKFPPFFPRETHTLFLLAPSSSQTESVHVCRLSHFSCVRLFATPWTVAHQAPLSMGFSRQEYWSGLLCPPPGDLPDPEIKLESLMSPALASGFFTTSTTWEAHQRESR